VEKGGNLLDVHLANKRAALREVMIEGFRSEKRGPSGTRRKETSIKYHLRTHVCLTKNKG